MMHPSHTTRYSDSSQYDEVCTLCGATDAPGSSALQYECPGNKALLRDFLDQKIFVGSKILWSGGQGEYSGFEQIFEVLKVSEKMITIQRKGRQRRTVVHPNSVVVVDRLLK